MIARWAQPGRVDWIGVRPARGAELQVLDRVNITDNGLDGDRGRAGKRAVTLMQAEHVPVISSCLGRTDLGPEVFRRNILISGLNLNGLKAREVQIGSAIVRITTICAPCSLMERLIGHGAYAAMRGHGGWCAEVVQPGTVTLGDQVQPID
ncbi:MOSC domain-containing protein [Tateyamaria omphalii]|nr:MOSC domain-containing protein [Tateyamaria omphalii]